MLQVGRGASSMSPECRACFLISTPTSHLNDGARRPTGLHQSPHPPTQFPLTPPWHPPIKPIYAPDHKIPCRGEHELLN